METEEDGWVTGPALEVALKLGFDGIRVGDSIILQRCEETHIDAPLEGHIVVVTHTTHRGLTHIYGNKKYTYICTVTGGWSVYPENIAAWKPQRPGTSS